MDFQKGVEIALVGWGLFLGLCIFIAGVFVLFKTGQWLTSKEPVVRVLNVVEQVVNLIYAIGYAITMTLRKGVGKAVGKTIDIFVSTGRYCWQLIYGQRELILSVAFIGFVAYLPFGVLSKMGVPWEGIKGIMSVGLLIGIVVAPFVGAFAFYNKERPLKATLWGIATIPTIAYVSVWGVFFLAALATD